MSDGLDTVTAELELTVIDADPGAWDEVLLSEDFADGIGAWAVLDAPGADDAPSDWRGVNGRATQRSKIQLPIDGVGDVSYLGTTLHYGGGSAWVDYRATATLRAIDDNAVGLMFRYQDDLNYYRVSWDVERNYIRLVKRLDGEFTVLAEMAGSFARRQEHTVEVQVQGGAITVHVDSSLLFGGEVVDEAPIASGTVALYCWANRAIFDYVEVVGP